MFVLDLDECCASVHHCDVNANCQNTPGSYLCSCKNGFIGDGRTCTGTYKIYENRGNQTVTILDFQLKDLEEKNTYAH